MKTVFRTQRGGFCGVPREEDTASLQMIPAPPVVLSQQQHEDRERRMKANYRQPQEREYYDPLPCVLSIKEREDGA